MAGVFSQHDLITHFLRGCLPSLRPVLRHTRRLYQGPNAFQDFLEHAIAQGESHRALVKGTTEKRVQGRPKQVLAVQGHSDIADVGSQGGSSIGVTRGDPINMVGSHGGRGDSSFSNYTEHTPAGTGSFHTAADCSVMADHGNAHGEILAVRQQGNGNFRGFAQPSQGRGPKSPRRDNRRQASWVKDPPPAVNAKEAEKAIRQDWEVRFQDMQGQKGKESSIDICFVCYEGGHRKTNFPYGGALPGPFWDAFVKKNYFKLAAVQQEWLHRQGHTPEFALPPGLTHQAAVAPDQDIKAGAAGVTRIAETALGK